MRILLVGGLGLSGFLLLAALIGLQPIQANHVSVSIASSSDPVVPVPLAETFLDPGPGLSPGAARVHPVSGDVWICRAGGSTILRGAELREIVPGPCPLGFHAQTGQWFAADGRSVVIMSRTTPIARVNLPYTVTGGVLHPRTQLLYVTMQANPYPLISTHLAVISATSVLTIMSAPGAYFLVPHPESGDLYLGVYTGTQRLWILSGTERVASLPLDGPLYFIVYHPYSRLTYVASQNEMKILHGRSVSATLPVTETYQIAVDPNSDRAYATHMIPDFITVLSRTEVIARIPFPHGFNPIDVISPSGEIVAGAYFSQELHVFSRELSPVTVISMPVRPRVIASHPHSWVYVTGKEPDPGLSTDLLVLSRTTPVAEYRDGFGLGSLALSPDGKRLYALNIFEGILYVLSGTEVLTRSPLSPWTHSIFLPQERQMAVDMGTGWVYVAHPQFMLLWIRQGEGWITRPLSFSISTLFSDPAHGVIWGGASDRPWLLAITGTTVSTLPIGSDPLFWPPVRGIAVDPGRHYLYAMGSAQLAVFSLTHPITASFWLTTLGEVYPPRALAVQPANGLAYVGSGIGPTGTVWIFEGPAPVARRTVEGVPVAIGADPASGWVYVALSGTRQVAVLTGTQWAFTVSLPFEPRRIWVSPWSRLAYVAGDVQIAALEGSTVRKIITTGIVPRDMVFDPAARLAILSHEGDNRLAWIEERILDRRIWLPLILKGP